MAGVCNDGEGVTTGFAVFKGRAGAGFTNGNGIGSASLTTKNLASKVCGSMVMFAVPKLCIDLTSGLFGGSSIIFLRLTGLTQYFLKIPSHNHCIRDRCREADNVALSAID